MKSIASSTFAILIVTIASVAGEDQTNTKPQEMSLRLELFVTDLETSTDFYTKVLGFERLKGQGDYAPVRCGQVVIGLGRAAGLPKNHFFNPEVQKARRGLGTEIVLEVDDVQGFFQKVKASGYQGILSSLRKRPWGLTDFRIADPDGYYLRITSR